MDSKHTSGPWETDGISVRSAGPDGRAIALCEITVRGRPYYETYDEALANARLIAAAPELLEALKEMKAAVFGTTLGDEPDVYKDYDRLSSLCAFVISVIAKAEGK